MVVKTVAHVDFPSNTVFDQLSFSFQFLCFLGLSNCIPYTFNVFVYYMYGRHFLAFIHQSEFLCQFELNTMLT